MSVAYETTTEHEVRDTLVRFLQEVPFARRLWARTERGHITFWLLTDPVSRDEEMSVYQANRLIYQNVPEARFDFLVVNPAVYEEPFEFALPLGMQEIPIR